jgi:hypothetical protein
MYFKYKLGIRTIEEKGFVMNMQNEKTRPLSNQRKELPIFLLQSI